MYLEIKNTTSKYFMNERTNQNKFNKYLELNITKAMGSPRMEAAIIK